MIWTFYFTDVAENLYLDKKNQLDPVSKANCSINIRIFRLSTSDWPDFVSFCLDISPFQIQQPKSYW